MIGYDGYMSGNSVNIEKFLTKSSTSRNGHVVAFEGAENSVTHTNADQKGKEYAQDLTLAFTLVVFDISSVRSQIRLKYHDIIFLIDKINMYVPSVQIVNVKNSNNDDNDDV